VGECNDIAVHAGEKGVDRPDTFVGGAGHEAHAIGIRAKAKVCQ